MTYQDLADLLGYGGAGIMGERLDPIAACCALNKLPLLNDLVVGKDTSLPTKTLSDDPHVSRKEVFQYPWFTVYPPTAEDFAEAFEEAKARGWDFTRTA